MIWCPAAGHRLAGRDRRGSATPLVSQVAAQRAWARPLASQQSRGQNQSAQERRDQQVTDLQDAGDLSPSGRASKPDVVKIAA